MGDNQNQFIREKFSSRWIFVLAAVGSAAGLGNLWRFPYLAYEHGGGAFFIAYIVCLAILGLPFLTLENGLGQITSKAAPGAMGSITKDGTFRAIGWLAILATFVVTSYYLVITSWTLNYAVFSPAIAWQADSHNFFYQNFLKLTSSIDLSGSFNPNIVIGTAIVYAILYFAIRKGTSGISMVAKYVTPIPFVLLTLLAINSLTLTGSKQGLEFIFIPKMSALLDASTWFAAASQVFFSLSIGFGAMFAYGSLLKKEVNIKTTAIAILCGDTLVSIIGSIAVFGVVGFMAHQQHEPIPDVIKAGIGLAFVVIPKAITLLPVGQPIFATAFFVALFCLAFTSIVSLFEAMTAGVMETSLKLKRSTILFFLVVIEFCVGLLYMKHNGLYVLDIVDHYVNGYALMSIAFFEAILVGWLYRANKLRLTLNKNSNSKITRWFNFNIKYLCPIIIAILLGKQIIKEFGERYGNYDLPYLLWYGVFVLALMIIGAVLLMKLDKKQRA